MLKKKKAGNSVLPSVVAVAALVLMLLCFSLSLSALEGGRRGEGAMQLEEAIRRSAVSCYAAEGSYPADLTYLEEHYGLQTDEENYLVRYEPIAENLMPDITVIDKKQG